MSHVNKFTNISCISLQVTRKLNFLPNYTVFKNLIPINVNDSILMPRQEISLPQKYGKTDKICPPELCDFLKPVEHNIYTEPEPNLKLQFCDYEFDILSNYSRFIA